MRRADVVCAGVLLAVGIVVVLEGLRLGIGWSTDGPQSGFFVFYLGVAHALACGVIVLQAVLAGDRPLYRKTFVRRDQLASVAKVAVPAALMVFLTYFLGLYVSGALYTAVYMRWIGGHPWRQTVVVSLAIPLVSFLIFEIWFLVPMPKGPLEAYLGY
jgi:putative tricarboxylic transport membrane protein